MLKIHNLPALHRIDNITRNVDMGFTFVSCHVAHPCAIYKRLPIESHQEAPVGLFFAGK